MMGDNKENLRLLIGMAMTKEMSWTALSFLFNDITGCIDRIYKFSDIRILDQTIVTIYNYFSIHNYNITVV